MPALPRGPPAPLAPVAAPAPFARTCCCRLPVLPRRPCVAGPSRQAARRADGVREGRLPEHDGDEGLVDDHLPLVVVRGCAGCRSNGQLLWSRCRRLLAASSGRPCLVLMVRTSGRSSLCFPASALPRGEAFGCRDFGTLGKSMLASFALMCEAFGVMIWLRNGILLWGHKRMGILGVPVPRLRQYCRGVRIIRGVCCLTVAACRRLLGPLPILRLTRPRPRRPLGLLLPSGAPEPGSPEPGSPAMPSGPIAASPVAIPSVSASNARWNPAPLGLPGLLHGPAASRRRAHGRRCGLFRRLATASDAPRFAGGPGRGKADTHGRGSQGGGRRPGRRDTVCR